MAADLTNLPILYSLQHCPYAMRARIAIFKSALPVRIRAIKLNNKPPEMLALSTDNTVPMLVIEDEQQVSTVIEESLDIMLYILRQNDPNQLLQPSPEQSLNDNLRLISEYEQHFLPAVEAYKCAKRYKEPNVESFRQHCEVYLQPLEDKLHQHSYLTADKEGIVDIALIPFIRQFSKVERQWFQQSPYPKLRAWLNHYMQSPMFTKIMAKHTLWVDCHQDIIFGDIKK